MIPILIGNICSLLAMISDSISSSRKTSRGVLLVQALSQVFYGTGAIVLRGYSAAVQNAMALVRNLLACRGDVPKWLQWTLTVLGVALGILWNNRGAVGLLPVIANLLYTVVIFRAGDNDRPLKLAFLINLVLYTVFNVCILNFVGALSNAAVAAATGIFLLTGRKKQA